MYTPTAYESEARVHQTMVIITKHTVQLFSALIEVVLGVRDVHSTVFLSQDMYGISISGEFHIYLQNAYDGWQ